jgi:hypothetical protein
MTGLVLILLLGSLILTFAVRLLLQSLKARIDGGAVTVDDFSRAREALDSALVAAAAINRIFSSEDMEFISRSASNNARRLFLRERKILALQWLRLMQKQVAQLMDVHLRLAGHTYDPSPGFEFRLTAKYLTFALFSYIVMFQLWMRGPFKASRTTAYAIHAAQTFCSVFSLRLEQVNPARLSSGRESLVH